MACTKGRTRTYSAGERGRNRVRTFPCPKTGIYQVEWREGGKRCSESREHRDFERAKRQADAFAARFFAKSPKPKTPGPPTLRQLFDIYEKEVTPTKGHRSQKHDRRALAMFVDFLGADRDPTSLSRRDWDRFVRARTSGEVGPSGRRVTARTVERDLRLLLAVFNWAEQSRDSSGSPLLHHSPFRGLTPPREKNPRRVVLTDEEYASLLGVAEEIDWRFMVALVLAHETGHRNGAIRQLRWSDIDFEAGQIRWRATTEKTGFEHTTPMTIAAQRALEDARGHQAGLGEAPVFPAPGDGSSSASRYLMRDWWRRAEKAAGLDPKRGRGWYSLRRKFASDLMQSPLKVLCELGGWKTHETVLECYQHPDAAALRSALEARRRA